MDLNGNILTFIIDGLFLFEGKNVKPAEWMQVSCHFAMNILTGAGILNSGVVAILTKVSLRADVQLSSCS